MRWLTTLFSKGKFQSRCGRIVCRTYQAEFFGLWEANFAAKKLTPGDIAEGLFAQPRFSRQEGPAIGSGS
jgi:hypothetical protein